MQHGARELDLEGQLGGASADAARARGRARGGRQQRADVGRSLRKSCPWGRLGEVRTRAVAAGCSGGRARAQRGSCQSGLRGQVGRARATREGAQQRADVGRSLRKSCPWGRLGEGRRRAVATSCDVESGDSSGPAARAARWRHVRWGCAVRGTWEQLGRVRRAAVVPDKWAQLGQVRLRSILHMPSSACGAPVECVRGVDECSVQHACVGGCGRLRGALPRGRIGVPGLVHPAETEGQFDSAAAAQARA